MSIRHKEGEKKKVGRDHGIARRRLLLPVAAIAILVLGIGAATLYYYSEQTFLYLNGEDQVSVGLRGYYEDPGVSAKRWGRDVSKEAQVSGMPDMTVPGEYTVTYRSGDLHVDRHITVLDHMVPELVLKGQKQVSLLLGETYDEEGYRAAGEDGENLTDQVSVEAPAYDRAGKFTIEYTVSDGEGHTTKLHRRVTIQPNTEYETPGLPICMYHYVYDENDPPEDVNRRYKNYISRQDLIEEMNWLNQEGYYYPTWEEVRDYVDGKLLLPEKSIVLTFDDGEYATLDQLIPIVEQTHVPVTSFLITEHAGEKKVEKYQSEYLRFESHTHAMHHAGGVSGYRGMLPVIDFETGLADLKESIRICGSGLAIAYPYGDYNENTRLITEQAGFLCGVTTQFGNARPGMNPLALPRIRMWQDQTLEYFQRNVAPPGSLLVTP